MIQTESKRDYAVSIVRILAMAAIFSCHVLQYVDNFLAWWLNVGVQIFLVMSGYLYGTRSEKTLDDIQFYKKSFSKILLDYYIVIIPVLIYQLITIPGKISGDRAYKILVTYKVLNGGQHLWYIPYILVCYLITPFCVRLFKNNDQKPAKLVLSYLGLIIINHILHDTFFKYFTAVWINCYITGLFLGFCMEHGHNRIKISFISVISVLAIAFNAVRICILYVWDIQIEEPYDELAAFFYQISHGLLGCFLFFALRLIFTPIGHLIEKSPMVCSFFHATDSLCYDIYLVHHFFILDRYSLMDRTDSILVNVINIIVATLILAVIVWKLSSFIMKITHKKPAKQLKV